ncbi:hypothetical protein R1sor_013104 [Riccia sorocarpa]|uniref:Uncharacterized protein n=1 Tax=Riccia sorocarpa TaxID=122646 RepID=A0ABD3H955_9MARC
MGENQLAPTFFLEPTPKCYKKARKQVVEETTDDDSTLLEETEKKPPIEAQAILLETAYHMCEKPKEVNDLISAKYLETLLSKVEDVTRILELEGLLEASGIAAPKRSDGGHTRAFTEVVQAQLGELSRILSIIEGDGPTSAIAFTAEEPTEMLAPVPLPTEGDSILSAGSSGR